MRATNLPRLIQAFGVWLVVMAVTLSFVGAWLIRRFVQPDYDFSNTPFLVGRRVWPEQDLLLGLTLGAAIVGVLLILVGAALRLTRRPD